MARIAICGETHSQNLGDGVIAESLAYLIRRAIPDSQIVYLDISGRPDRGGNEPPIVGLHRGFGWNLYGRSRAFRRVYAMLSLLLVPLRDRPAHGPLDLAIIGGGQLIMDNELNFPTKIFRLVHFHLARDTKCLAIYSCGVGSAWSSIGRVLYGRVLRDRRMTCRMVRDEDSRRNLIRVFRLDAADVDIAHDPALCAAEAYGMAPSVASTGIGLGIMAPLDDMAGVQPQYAARFGAAFLTKLWTETAVELAESGQAVRLFTNGAPSDQAFAETIWRALPDRARDRVTVCPRPERPEQLVRLIAGFRAILAQRMHAHVVAFSLGVPSVGLVWDSKLREFGALTGRGNFFLEPDAATPPRLLERLDTALREGVDEAHARRLRAEAHASMHRLLRRVGLVMSENSTGLP